MSDPQRDQPYNPEPVRKDSDSIRRTERGVAGPPPDDRGGFNDTAPNPHDRQGTVQTAAQATGWMTAMMLPAVVVAIVAIVIILYFVLR